MSEAKLKRDLKKELKGFLIFLGSIAIVLSLVGVVLFIIAPDAMAKWLDKKFPVRPELT